MRKKKNSILNIDGKPHRKRRGKLVEIPAEWKGKVVHKLKRRKRDARARTGPEIKDAQGTGTTPMRLPMPQRGEEALKDPERNWGPKQRPYNRSARNDRKREAVEEDDGL